MSIAVHAARLSTQFSLDLDLPTHPPTPTRVAEPPSLHELAAAALENVHVRRFIAQGLMTWTHARVTRDPPFWLIYEHGEVLGNISDMASMIRHAEKRKGIGHRTGMRALSPDERFLPYNIGLKWGPTHPHRRRWEQRMALKSLLPRADRLAVGSAMQRNSQEFVAWARARPGLAARIADVTGLTLGEFWRTVRGRNIGLRSSPDP